MAAPQYEVVQKSIQNPHASMPLIVPVMVLANTSDADIERNIRANTLLPHRWIAASPAHERTAVMVGGGASIEDHIEDIRRLSAEGADIFAMNAASFWLRGKGIAVDFQCIADAKHETGQLVDPNARMHLFASQVHPETMARIAHPKVWHLEVGNIERFCPEERVRRGGYALIVGRGTVGNSALCLAYAMGYRTLHIFGYDSSHRQGRSHAYHQPMNQFIPTVDVEWGGRTFTASVAMKAQAEQFQVTAAALKQAGVSVHVYGDGLLQTMWRTPPLSEREKYKLLWQFDGYRNYSPGEEAVAKFLEIARPDGLIVDFGCGTGRAAIALHKAGHEVFLVDFADNCRDHEALGLPFLEWDLTKPMPVSAPFGICADVMEHMPTTDVDVVLANIMRAAERVFFQISTQPDDFGKVVHAPLHNTVQPHAWWRDRFASLGFEIIWQEEVPAESRFFVRSSQTGY